MIVKRVGNPIVIPDERGPFGYGFGKVTVYLDRDECIQAIADYVKTLGNTRVIVIVKLISVACKLQGLGISAVTRGSIEKFRDIRKTGFDPSDPRKTILDRIEEGEFDVCVVDYAHKNLPLFNEVHVMNFQNPIFDRYFHILSSASK